MKKALVCLVIAITGGATAHKAMAQIDPHFTQYYVHPSWLNPALTGLFDGEYRASAIYRNQWGNVSSPFSTIGASIEATTNKNTNWGVNLINQRSNNGGFNYTTAYGNFNYTGVRFGAQEYQRISMGIQMGFLQRRIDPSKLVFGDEFNHATGTMQPTREIFTNTSAMVFDAGAGIMYHDATPGRKANLFAGFSASHITRPENKFSESGTEKMPVRFTGHAGVRLTLSDVLSLTPNALYLSQGNATEKMIGMYAQIKAAETTDLMLGMNYRLQDAMAVHAGFSHNGFVVSASYDINTSDLGKLISGTNSFEISISFTSRKKTKTPEVEFVCPRL